MHGIPRLGWGRIFFIIYSVLALKTIWKTESNIPDCVCLIAWFLSVSSADDECICWVTVASFAILTCPWHGCNLHLFKCKQCSLQQLSTQEITVLCVLCLSVEKWISEIQICWVGRSTTINPPLLACCWLSSFDRLIPAQSPTGCRGGRVSVSPLSTRLCDSGIGSLGAVTTLCKDQKEGEMVIRVGLVGLLGLLGTTAQVALPHIISHLICDHWLNKQNQCQI